MKMLFITAAVVFAAANASVLSCLLMASLSDRFLKRISVDPEQNTKSDL